MTFRINIYRNKISGKLFIYNNHKYNFYPIEILLYKNSISISEYENTHIAKNNYQLLCYFIYTYIDLEDTFHNIVFIDHETGIKLEYSDIILWTNKSSLIYRFLYLYKIHNKIDYSLGKLKKNILCKIFNLILKTYEVNEFINKKILNKIFNI